MKKLIILMVFVSIFMISIVSAEHQYIKNGVGGTISTPVYDENFLPLVSCDANITINYPNGSILINNQVMTCSSGTASYPISPENSQIDGFYSASAYACSSGKCGFSVFSYEVNALGKELTTGQGIIYFVVLIISVLLFGLSIIAGIKIESENSRDAMTGYIIAVNNKKYLKMFSWCVAYLILMLIFYISYIISYSYLALDFLSSLFRFGFYAMVIGLLPLFIVGTYIVIANAVRDSKIADALSGGLRIRE